MTRIVLLGVLLVFVVHIVRKILSAVIMAARQPDGGVAGTPKSRDDDIDMSKVKDADFRDIDG